MNKFIKFLLSCEIRYFLETGTKTISVVLYNNNTPASQLQLRQETAQTLHSDAIWVTISAKRYALDPTVLLRQLIAVSLLLVASGTTVSEYFQPKQVCNLGC